ncbi:glycoside hydrolase/deacetylase [Neocallimastix californiae]|uniref:Glycoside hydrolase/deacetylase n=1 Tax=Neocallimastix californiae TaxID=1754190 RepID=A0A1Y2F5R8_9FUNG|nr:glycoside hydrolase/deacetylase [Neocallimastix californiae]|eukprot:ORY79242.1 glycoside hydrolase/deacetylase [Neocallimastix californiae]
MISKQDVKISFFHVAKLHYPYAEDVSEYQEAMKKAHDHGFQIASHTYSHKISDDNDEFRKSLVDMDDFIEDITGDRPRYFRAPKGHCNEKCQANLEKWGYQLIQWDTDTNDWDLETSGSIEQRVEDSIDFLKKSFAEERDNYLILMHDSQNYTVNEIAPWIIEKSGMKEKGYRFVTVAECLGDKDGMYTSGRTYIDDKNVDNDLSAVIFENGTIIDGDSDVYMARENENNEDNNNNININDNINVNDSINDNDNIDDYDNNNVNENINDYDNNNINDNISVNNTDYDDIDSPLNFIDDPISQNLDSSSIISTKPMSFLSIAMLCIFSIILIIIN